MLNWLKQVCKKGTDLLDLHIILFSIGCWSFNYTLGIHDNSGNCKWSLCLSIVISVRNLKFPLLKFLRLGGQEVSVFFSFFHRSQVLWMLFLFCQISLEIRLEHSTGITHHALFCLPSLSASLVEVCFFWDSYVYLYLENGHSMYCTTQADIIMTEESTADELSEGNIHTLCSVYFLTLWTNGKSEQTTHCLCWKQCLLVALLL